MKRTLYYQCRLRRQNCEQVSFLPQKFALAGRTLRLKQADGTWQDGWSVATVYGDPIPEALMPDVHDAVKTHRRATGDAARRSKS